MTVFESKALVNKPLSQVYEFLADMNNHQGLMPDNISNWTSTRNEASFSIQNMGNLSLKISNRKDDVHTIIIVPAQAAPFGIEIRWVLTDAGNNTTRAVLTLSAELNMMMKMMASGPLQKLVDHQTSQLERTA